MNNEVPVLLVIFNRPEKTRRVIEALRQVKPTQLFVAADGPRLDHPDDVEKCRLTREIATNIDWSCDMKTRLLDKNIGCDPCVSSAINWFFEHVAQGVILEDDCVPHPHFFRFCADMFERYADDARIMQVSGYSPCAGRRYPYDYHFGRFFRCGGCWGTWRRAWALYADSLEQYDNNGTIKQILKAYFPSSAQYTERLRLYRMFRLGKRDNWDFKWNVACYAQNALCIVPERNLMTNIGFDEESTHTKVHNWFSHLQTDSLDFPLCHPPFVFADIRPERELSRRIFRSLPFKSRCVRRLRHALGAMADFFETMSPI
ncbi:MAG: glycosyltransferase family 2 protein [Desulfobacterales bacterium]|nr:glycosyltransferase family 2 protein [Desulfobacterales bacterium]